jgi:hypothetical protein
VKPRLVAVAAPLFIALALGIGVGMVGTALAARLGDSPTAAFALALARMAAGGARRARTASAA